MASSDGPTTQMVGNVAVLPVFGVLSQKSNWLTRALGWTSTETFERDFRDAVASSQVKAIVMLVDSPGGSAIGNEEVSNTIYAARGVKPVYTFIRGIGASAAYYFPSAAEPGLRLAVIDHRLDRGCQHARRVQQGDGRSRLRRDVVRSAPNKQLWNSFEKLTPEAKASLQKWVGAYGDQFEKAVAKNRGVSQADVKARFGQGDAFLAAEAQQRGLIDGVMTFEQLLAKAQRQQ
jgi:ClpP class serine protease